MSRMSDLYIDIQEEIERGQLDFYEIAHKFHVDHDTVCMIADELRMHYEAEDSGDRDRPIEADDSWLDLEY